jgi:hypothetical protein
LHGNAEIWTKAEHFHPTQNRPLKTCISFSKCSHTYTIHQSTRGGWKKLYPPSSYWIKSMMCFSFIVIDSFVLMHHEAYANKLKHLWFLYTSYNRVSWPSILKSLCSDISNKVELKAPPDPSTYFEPKPPHRRFGIRYSFETVVLEARFCCSLSSSQGSMCHINCHCHRHVPQYSRNLSWYIALSALSKRKEL